VGCIEKGNISKRKGYCSAAKEAVKQHDVIVIIKKNR
jgi:hypothetical protein